MIDIKTKMEQQEMRIHCLFEALMMAQSQIIVSEYETTAAATYKGMADGEKHGEIRVLVPDCYVGRQFKICLIPEGRNEN